MATFASDGVSSKRSAVAWVTVDAGLSIVASSDSMSE